MKETCREAGQKMNVNLDDFYLYFVTKIAKCKPA
jgi:flagellin-specific chaperone FliS